MQNMKGLTMEKWYSKKTRNGGKHANAQKRISSGLEDWIDDGAKRMAKIRQT